MKFAAVKNNQYTGVIYNELTPETQSWVDTTEGVSLVVINSETEALIKFVETQAGDNEADYPEVSQEVICETVRYYRGAKIEAARWRIERHNDELALGVEPTEPLEPLLQYVQALRDVPEQEGFPADIVWPEQPEAQI